MKRVHKNDPDSPWYFSGFKRKCTVCGEYFRTDNRKGCSAFICPACKRAGRKAVHAPKKIEEDLFGSDMDVGDI